MKIFAPITATEGYILNLNREGDSLTSKDVHGNTWMLKGAQGDLTWWFNFSQLSDDNKVPFVGYEIELSKTFRSFDLDRYIYLSIQNI